MSVQKLYYHHWWYWQKLYFHALHVIILCILCESNHLFTPKVSSLPLSMVHPFVFSHCPSLQPNFSCHWLSMRSGLVCELSRYTAYFSYRGGSGSSTTVHVVDSCTNLSQYCAVTPTYIIQFWLILCYFHEPYTSWSQTVCGFQRDENRPSLPPKQIFIHSNASLWYVNISKFQSNRLTNMLYFEQHSTFFIFITSFIIHKV